MSLLKFELKESHIKLLKHFNWRLTDDKFILSSNGPEDVAPFGADNVYEGLDLILNGKPENFDPLNTFEAPKYSEEQIAEWDKLLYELPIALDIILYNGHFTLGTYKTRYHDRDWKKIKI